VPIERDMTDLDKFRGRKTESGEREGHIGLQAVKLNARGLDTELFGWAGRLGLRRHHQWLVAPCDQDADWTPLLAGMIRDHPAPQRGWLLRTPHGNVLIPGPHKRVPQGAQKARVVRGGLFPLGRKWEPYEDWFCLDEDGVVWANDMAMRALDMMETHEEVARYAAEALATARTRRKTL